jgi:hypothetical protein
VSEATPWVFACGLFCVGPLLCVGFGILIGRGLLRSPITIRNPLGKRDGPDPVGYGRPNNSGV